MDALIMEIGAMRERLGLVLQIQRDHTETMAEILKELHRLQVKPPAPSPKNASPLTTLHEFLQPTVRGAVQWAAGVMTLVYVFRGGDIQGALKMLAAFF